MPGEMGLGSRQEPPGAQSSPSPSALAPVLAAGGPAPAAAGPWPWESRRRPPSRARPERRSGALGEPVPKRRSPRGCRGTEENPERLLSLCPSVPVPPLLNMPSICTRRPVSVSSPARPRPLHPEAAALLREPVSGRQHLRNATAGGKNSGNRTPTPRATDTPGRRHRRLPRDHEHKAQDPCTDVASKMVSFLL